jgi:hypothetical protein
MELHRFLPYGRTMGAKVRQERRGRKNHGQPMNAHKALSAE